MNRGEIWVAADHRENYTTKPRPVLIVQQTELAALDSVTVCPLTTDMTVGHLLRIPVTPGTSGLDHDSTVMIDKVTTVRRERLGRRLGALSDPAMSNVATSLAIHLGIV